jgi:hypothetical protein
MLCGGRPRLRGGGYSADLGPFTAIAPMRL